MSPSADARGGPVLVFSEREDVARELLAPGRRLADTLRVRLLSAQVRGAADAFARGADGVFEASAAPDGAGITVEFAVDLLHESVRRSAPAIVLVGATRFGAEVAARLGQRLGAPCSSECLSVDVDEQGALLVERRVYGGRFVARRVHHAAPALATIAPRTFEAPAADPGRSGAVEPLEVARRAPRIRVLASVERERSRTDIAKAEVLVSAGRGFRRREDLALVERLANALGGSVAASRPLTDDLRWLPADQRVGLSGRSVRPRLYVACGISGQIEHIVGMREARTVVAINNDPRAPIHAEADFSIVGDLYEILPALIAEIEAARARIRP
jgi:electron transfer flavoprotein alpha subunit